MKLSQQQITILQDAKLDGNKLYLQGTLDRMEFTTNRGYKLYFDSAEQFIEKFMIKHCLSGIVEVVDKKCINLHRGRNISRDSIVLSQLEYKGSDGEVYSVYNTRKAESYLYLSGGKINDEKRILFLGDKIFSFQGKEIEVKKENGQEFITVNGDKYIKKEYIKEPTQPTAIEVRKDFQDFVDIEVLQNVKGERYVPKDLMLIVDADNISLSPYDKNFAEKRYSRPMHYITEYFIFKDRVKNIEVKDRYCRSMYRIEDSYDINSVYFCSHPVFLTEKAKKLEKEILRKRGREGRLAKLFELQRAEKHFLPAKGKWGFTDPRDCDKRWTDDYNKRKKKAKRAAKRGYLTTNDIKSIAFENYRQNHNERRSSATISENKIVFSFYGRYDKQGTEVESFSFEREVVDNKIQLDKDIVNLCFKKEIATLWECGHQVNVNYKRISIDAGK